MYSGIYDATLAVGQEIVDNNSPPRGNPSGIPSLYGIDWRALAIAVIVFIAIAVITKSGSIVLIGSVLRRKGFGGGRSGGGGAKG